MSMRFTLVSGGHRNGKKVYDIGDTVFSDRPLHKIFKNKFQLIEGGETKAPPVEVTAAPAVPKVEESKAEETVSRSKKSSVTYKKVKKGKNRYDVVSSKGKVMNEEYLSKSEAEELIAAYSEESE